MRQSMKILFFAILTIKWITINCCFCCREIIRTHTLLHLCVLMYGTRHFKFIIISILVAGCNKTNNHKKVSVFVGIHKQRESVFTSLKRNMYIKDRLKSRPYIGYTVPSNAYLYFYKYTTKKSTNPSVFCLNIEVSIIHFNHLTIACPSFSLLWFFSFCFEKMKRVIKGTHTHTYSQSKVQHAVKWIMNNMKI